MDLPFFKRPFTPLKCYEKVSTATVKIKWFQCIEAIALPLIAFNSIDVPTLVNYKQSCYKWNVIKNII